VTSVTKMPMESVSSQQILKRIRSANSCIPPGPAQLGAVDSVPARYKKIDKVCEAALAKTNR
jgi:hypothetical protein